MKRFQWAIFTATLYLIIYVAAFANGAGLRTISILFLISPIPVAWMVFEILVNAAYKGHQLNEGEAFGYADKPNDQLGFW